MKKLKKILSIVLTLAMVLGMSVTTWAASAGDDNTVGTKDDRGSITLAGIAKEAGIQIALYPVMQAQYDSKKGNFTGYSNPYNVPTDDKGNYTVDADELEAIVTAVTEANVTALNGVTWTSYEDANGFGYKTNDTVPVGMYLVAVTGAEAKIYNYAVASVYYESKNGGNLINGGTVDFISDANVGVKVSENPGVTKTAKDKDNNVTGSVNIGDTVKYEVEINPVPYYGGEYPVLNVTDTLSDGLTLDKNSIKVYHTAVAESNLLTADYYTLDTDTPQTLVVDFVKKDINTNTNIYNLNKYAGGKIIITYSATLNDEAGINQAGNNNDVTLKYTKDSKVETTTENPPEEKKDKTFTYTFDIDGSVTGSVTKGIITKYGEEKDTTTDENLPLPNAEFTLYTDEACNTPYTNKSLVEKDNSKIPFDGTVASNGEGQLPIKGLATGTYYLKETKAPDGYSLNTHVFKIEISAKYYGDTDVEGGQIPDGMKKGQLASWSIKIDNEDIATFTVNNGNVDNFDEEAGVGIQNTKISSLPSTGGIGTTIFTIGGCAIMILAAGLYFASRRKSAK